MTIHFRGTPCANLRNMTVSDNKDEVDCSRCLPYVYQKEIRKLLSLGLDSSSYEHSGNKFTDNTRKIPEFTILSKFGSFKTPKMLIRKLDFDKLEESSEIIIISASVNSMNAEYYTSIQENLELIDNLLFRNTSKAINFVTAQSSERMELSYGRSITVNYLWVKAEIDILALYTLAMISTKMAQVQNLNKTIATFDLLSQIISNQKNTSQKNYRSVLRTLFSGEYWGIENKCILCPSTTIIDLYSTFDTPSWIGTSRRYISEIRLALGQY